MVTWIPSIYPLYVSIYTSTMDPMGYNYSTNTMISQLSITIVYSTMGDHLQRLPSIVNIYSDITMITKDFPNGFSVQELEAVAPCWELWARQAPGAMHCGS